MTIVDIELESCSCLETNAENYVHNLFFTVPVILGNAALLHVVVSADFMHPDGASW